MSSKKITKSSNSSEKKSSDETSTLTSTSTSTLTSTPKFSDLIDVNEVRKMTEESKSKKDELFADASKEAFNFLIADIRNKIKNAAQRGYTSVTLVKWDKNDEQIFNGITISELFFKGSLKSDLYSYFNPDKNPTGYYVGFKKHESRPSVGRSNLNSSSLSNTADNKDSSYSIYLSWRTPNERKE